MSPNHILILPHSSILQHLFFFTTSFIHSNKNKKILSTSNKQLQLPVPTSFSPNAISLTQQHKILTGNWSSNPINNPNFPINVTDTTNPIYLNSNKKIKHRFNLSKKTTTNNRNIRNIRNIRNHRDIRNHVEMNIVLGKVNLGVNHIRKVSNMNHNPLTQS